ncbi:AbrB/MazE/SpoVT family DNA-binding domain-containing protein [Clostridium brassicae]|uniref:AbrB/MazE/SpoVT family DNA-binding domain-containing protein n=1 Tax=Clostridium brassicae TaxID=2999072 RepID=A0ABT4D9Y8_9CLOT|nr:AbrB/MazE/SpoVT family DNA-binding domain-containing protein [Clostridium brassicae]MCY6957844.1 AbrB/MazE/SpoVT family DNA-binding domain-containing protein [Clostridium brassicae]
MAKITFNKSGSGSITGRLNIPMALLKSIGITEEEREVELYIRDNKLIVEKIIKKEPI